MLIIDYWWVILQFGLAVFASARGWRFAPWGLYLFGMALTRWLPPEFLVIGGFLWPDMLFTVILFFMVAFKPPADLTSADSDA